MQKWIILILMATIYSACSTALTPILSKKEEGTKPEYRMSDPSSKLRFHLTNDQEYIYVYLNTNDPVTNRKIMETGLRVYFDDKGKRNTDCYVEYPMITRAEMDKETADQEPDLRKLLKKVSDDAAYKRSEGSPQRFDVLLSKTNVKVSLSVKDSTELDYELKMPLDWINPAGLEALDKLSFGIKSGSFDIPVKFEIRASSTQTGTIGNNNTMPGMSGNRTTNTDRQQRPDPIGYGSPVEFWYAIELAKK